MFKKPDLKASRNRLKKYNVQTKEFFNDFRNKYPEYKHLKDTELRKKLRLINEWIIEEILNTRDGVELPQGIGYMFIGSCPKKISPNPDMQKSYIYNQVVNNLKDMFYEYKESSYFIGIEFKYDNKTYNVFCVHPNEINSWQYATSMIKIMREDGGYFNEIKVDKKKRILLFESFRALLKGMLS